MSDPCILIYRVAHFVTFWWSKERESERASQQEMEHAMPHQNQQSLLHCAIANTFPVVWVTTCLNWKLFGIRSLGLRSVLRVRACCVRLTSLLTFKVEDIIRYGEHLLSIITFAGSAHYDFKLSSLQLATHSASNTSYLWKTSKQTSKCNKFSWEFTEQMRSVFINWIFIYFHDIFRFIVLTPQRFNLQSFFHFCFGLCFGFYSVFSHFYESLT